MQFRCPKCNYILTGTPDECPLCHTKLNYAVNSNAIPAQPAQPAQPAPAPEVAPAPNPGPAALTPEDVQKQRAERAKKRKITSFNVMALIYSLVCLLFFVGALMLPTMVIPAAGTSDLYVPIGAQPAPVPFGLLDYYVFQIYALASWIQYFVSAGAGSSLFPIILYLGFGYFEILFIVIGVLLTFFSTLCNIINLAKGKLPNYVAKSAVERFHDPLNGIGMIITFMVFLLLDLFVPNLLNKLFVDLGLSVAICPAIQNLHTISIFLIFAMFGVVFVTAIVKGAMRGSVNPKIYPGQVR